MPDVPSSICFQCGQATADGTRFNRLADGRPCPACAERLLMALPPLLPNYDASLEPEVEQPEPSEVDNDADYDRPA